MRGLIRRPDLTDGQNEFQGQESARFKPLNLNPIIHYDFKISLERFIHLGGEIIRHRSHYETASTQCPLQLSR